MTDDWDFYFLQVDHKPASIYVDLGIEGEAPLQNLPHLAFVRLHMNAPRDDGLSSREEFDTLAEIEDALTEAVCDDDAGYVGRNTSEGNRDFYFYVADTATWAARVDQVMATYPAYRFNKGSREEKDWSTYFEFLAPGDVDRQRIQDRRTCEALEEHGDKLTAPRQIDHWSYFPSAEAAQAFIADVQPLGFTVTDGPTRDDERGEFSVQLARTDVPSFNGIDAITLPLYEASLRHEGQYDGWACHVQE